MQFPIANIPVGNMLFNMEEMQQMTFILVITLLQKYRYDIET